MILLLLMRMPAPAVCSGTASASEALQSSSSGPSFCDDSKCGGPGIDDFPFVAGPCWFIKGALPAVCAGGFEPHSFPVYIDVLQYYTCCPILEKEDKDDDADADADEDSRGNETDTSSRAEANATSDDTFINATNTTAEQEGTGTAPTLMSELAPQCTACGIDVCWADAPHNSMVCDSEEFPHIRKTGAKHSTYGRWYHHYICCDSADGRDTPPLSRHFLVAEGFRAAFGSIALCCNLLLLLSIVRSPKVRGRSYNMYLLGLTVPDIVQNCLAITMGSRSIMGRQPTLRCWAHYFLGGFHAMSNTWFNAIIAYQVYKLLRDSHRRKHTGPPASKLVLKQAAAVYLAATCMGLFYYFAFCRDAFGVKSEEEPSKVFIAVTISIMNVPPILCVSCVSLHIWWGGFLPRTGRARVLALYFLRIVLVFFLFYLPNLVFLLVERFAANGGLGGGALNYAAWYLGSLQSVASFAVVLTKPDVKAAVRRLLKCESDADANANANNPRRDNFEETGFAILVESMQSRLSRASSYLRSRTSSLLGDSNSALKAFTRSSSGRSEVGSSLTASKRKLSSADEHAVEASEVATAAATVEAEQQQVNKAKAVSFVDTAAKPPTDQDIEAATPKDKREDAKSWEGSESLHSLGEQRSSQNSTTSGRSSLTSSIDGKVSPSQAGESDDQQQKAADEDGFEDNT